MLCVNCVMCVCINCFKSVSKIFIKSAKRCKYFKVHQKYNQANIYNLFLTISPLFIPFIL